MTFHQNLPPHDGNAYIEALDEVRRVVRELGSVPEGGATQAQWIAEDLEQAIRALDRVAWAKLEEVAAAEHAENPPLGVAGERVKVLNRAGTGEQCRGKEATVVLRRGEHGVELNVDGVGEVGYFSLDRLARLEPLFEVVDTSGDCPHHACSH